MPRALPFFRQRRDDTVLELLALEGRDAGRQFTVDGAEVAIGRGTPRSGQTGSIRLTDPTVSSQQAVLRRTRDGIKQKNIFL